MTDLRDSDRLFALVHVPTVHRVAVAAVFALDEQLGAIVASTTQPLIGQLRLTWWYDQLCALPAVPGGQPLLAALALAFAQSGLPGTELARLVEGWEALLEPLPHDDATLLVYAQGRATMFAVTAQILGCTIDARMGEGWALADYAGRCTDKATTVRGYVLARERLAGSIRLPRSLRVLARLARADAATDRLLPRTPWRLWRAAI